ncbi:MAG: pentapeptide repeat-containing protein [Solirubrobacteraceae bacterium]|nr:pentapeptide repeat-containing protein [Solirubrobacteraceae bacterium]
MSDRKWMPRPPRGAERVTGKTFTERKLLLVDAVLSDCDLSNLVVHGGSLRRVEIAGSRLVGFSFTESEAEDVRISDATLMLASFGHTRMHRVVFDGVNLREASFVGADLRGVVFDGCAMEGADFRNAKLTGCTLRGATLDGVLGVEFLRGLSMPPADIVESAAALAGALGIEVERPDPD